MHIVLFVVAAVLFGLHQAGILNAFSFAPLLHSYLDPLLLMPILLPLVQWEQKWLEKNRESRPLSKTKVLHLTISVSFIGEVLFPFFSSRFTPDVRDVACYFAGSALYLLCRNHQKA